MPRAPRDSAGNSLVVVDGTGTYDADGAPVWGGGGLPASVLTTDANPTFADVVSARPTGIEATDTANLQAFLNAMGAAPGCSGRLRSGTWTITPGAVKLPTALIPSGDTTHYTIYGKNVTIQAASNTAGALIGDNVPADMATFNNVNLARAFHIHGIQFFGTGLAGQIGLQIIGGGGGSSHDCEFDLFGTGRDYVGCQNWGEYNCRGLDNKQYGRRVRSAEGVVVGANASNSPSSNFTSICDRDYGGGAAVIAQYTFEGSDGCVMVSPITEGADPINAILFDGQSDNTIKNFAILGVWHNENAPTGAGLKIQNFNGGIIRVDCPWYQAPQTLIDATGQPSDCRIVIGNLPYVLTSVPPFKADISAGAASWTFRGATPTDFYAQNPALWSAGPPSGISESHQTAQYLGLDGLWHNNGNLGYLLGSRQMTNIVGNTIFIAALGGFPVEVGPNVALGAPSAETPYAANLPPSSVHLYLDEPGKILHFRVVDSAGTHFNAQLPYA